jgi:anti-sigma factor RsiW
MGLTPDQRLTLARLGEQLNLTPEAVLETVAFSMSLVEQAQASHLTLNQTIASLISVVSDLLRYNLPPVERARIAANISQGLWTGAGLPSDSPPDKRSDSAPGGALTNNTKQRGPSS